MTASPSPRRTVADIATTAPFSAEDFREMTSLIYWLCRRLDRYNNPDADAESRAIWQRELQEVGERANRLGGMPLMQLACERAQHGDPWVGDTCNRAWTGIGDWLA
jgi:hypothetical protein